jgi:hypothetical protein
MKEEQVVKMEFLLTLNENIVVQRFYNVRNYNPKAHRSNELREYFKQIQDVLDYDLKMKTVTYMMDNQDAIIDDPEILNTSNTEAPENFNLYVRIGEDTLCHRIFDGKVFPPKIRYTVDVRPHLKEFLRSLTEVFSSENLTYDYLGYDLSK